MKLSEELRQRGFVHQFTAETLEEIVDGAKRTVYHGVDPTADSIHAGNFVQFMLLRHLVEAGHKVIVLIGGGTGMIGDPKPDVERTLTPPDVVADRVVKLKAQAEKLLGGVEVEFVNNYDWLGELNLIEFLRDIGKHFTVNELMKKDAIATRLNSEEGISYTEFAYPLLQGYDFFMLHEKMGCDMQVGGSDQWGNIVAGVELIRKKAQDTAYALTVPLVIDKATGKKFGKSEGNAVWLDPEKTSPYAFYQFWLNVSDENVIEYLKLFTLLPLTEIEEIAQAFSKDPSIRTAQKTLAHEVTKLVHGEALAASAAKVSALLFGDSSISALSGEDIAVLTNNAPTYEVQVGTPVVDVLVGCGLATSKREARTFVEGNAVQLAGEKIGDVDVAIEEGVFHEGVALLRRGKKQYCVLIQK